MHVNFCFRYNCFFRFGNCCVLIGHPENDLRKDCRKKRLLYEKEFHRSNMYKRHIDGPIHQVSWYGQRAYYLGQYDMAFEYIINRLCWIVLLGNFSTVTYRNKKDDKPRHTRFFNV